MEPDDEGRATGSPARDTRRVTRRRPIEDALPGDRAATSGDEAPGDEAPAVATAVVRRRRPSDGVAPEAEGAPAAVVPPVPWRADPDRDDPWAAAPHRLRDLGTAERAVAAALVVMLALPFVVGLVRLQREGWMLNSDDALLGLRSLDVLGGDPPLIGQPSTSETAGGNVRTYHPGPIEMWAFTPLVHLLGGWGMVIGAAVVNLAALLTAVFVAFRRLGPPGGLAAAALAALLVRSVGLAVLTDPVSSNLWGLAIVAVAVTTWAVLDGDHRLLPLLAWWASWSAQQHLAALMPTAALVILALVGVAVPLVVATRRRRPVDLAPLRWLGVATVLAAGLWAPVMVQQVTGDPGNITAVVDYASVEGRTTQGFEGALHIAVRAIDPVPVLLRTDVRGTLLATDPGLLATALVGIVVIAGGLAAVAPGLARRPRLLLVTGLVLLPAGLANASNIPGNTVEVMRINLHRWVWPYSSFLVIGLLWAVGDLLLRRWNAAATAPTPVVRARAALAGRGAVVGVSLVALLVLAGAVPRGADDQTRDRYSSPLSGAVLDVIRDDMGDADRVLLIPGGAAAELSVVPAVTFALERDGVAVEVPDRLEPYFGDRGAGDDWDAAYVVTGAGSRPPAATGRVIADLLVDGRLARTVDLLSDALRASPVSINAQGEQRLSELTPMQAYSARLTLAEAADDPVTALLDPTVVALLDGGVHGFLADPELVTEHRRLLDEQHQVWLASRMVVLRVERGEVGPLVAQRSEASR